MANFTSRLMRRLTGRHKKHVDSPKLFRPSYFQRHPNQDFLIVAPGPSLNSYSNEIVEFIDRLSPIVLATNSVPSFIKPHYHSFANRKRWIRLGPQFDPEGKRVLFSPYFPKHLIRRFYRGPYEHLMFVDDTHAKFGVVDGIVQANCRSTALLLVGAAIAMGAGRIFAVGMDGYVKYLTGEGEINFDAAPPKYSGEEALGNKKHYADLHSYQVNFLNQIDEYLTSQGLPTLTILTPTDHKKLYKPFSAFL